MAPYGSSTGFDVNSIIGCAGGFLLNSMLKSVSTSSGYRDWKRRTRCIFRELSPNTPPLDRRDEQHSLPALYVVDRPPHPLHSNYGRKAIPRNVGHPQSDKPLLAGCA